MPTIRIGTPMPLRLVNLLLALMVLAMALARQAEASGVQFLEWGDLVPQKGRPVDPRQSWSEDDQFDFENYVWLQSLSDEERDAEVNQQTVSDVQRFLRRLKASGQIIDDLLAQVADYKAQVTAFGKRLVTHHGSRKVAMRGYLLPLAFNEAGTREFLLVPFVGACIHVPPPPANQIVLIRTREDFKVSETFAPVEVRGVMTAGIATRELTLVDGTDDVTLGYRIANAELARIDP